MVMGSRTHHDLAVALERDQIVPYFQPIVDLRSRVVTGFEVLARWIHPVDGVIAPDEFIPLAEEIGLIGDLTEHLVRRVFAIAPAIPEKMSISVNISSLQFRDRRFPADLERAASQGGFSLNRLVLEVTESALVGNIEQARAITHELKELGIRLALDDFGTGYSSLRHLQALPFDELKVDASFVRSMGVTRESRKIAAAVVGLGQSLGMTTVAEGVETRNQAEMLLWLGCDWGQGWLYGRPLPASSLAAVLSREAVLEVEQRDAEEVCGPIAPQLDAPPAQRLAQLQAIYDGVPVGLAFLDLNLRYLSINRYLAGLYKLPVADHLGRRLADVHPRRFALVEPYLRRALAGDSTKGVEVSDPYSDTPESPRTCIVSYEPVRDEAGEVIGVSVSVVDISERKRAEDALRKVEEHHRRAMELNPQITWTAEIGGEGFELDSKWERLTGMPTAEVYNHGWMKVVHPDDVAGALADMQQALATGETLDSEFRVREAGGSWRWMRNRATGLRDETGKLIRWYGTLEDVDERKRAEQALRRSETLLQAIFRAVPVGLIVAQVPSGEILMSNPQANRALGRPVITAKNIEDYRQSGACHADGSPFEPLDYPLARALLTRQAAGPDEMIYRTADGSRRVISAAAAPVIQEDGAVAAGVVAFQEIQETAEERQELLQRIAQLERENEALKSASPGLPRRPAVRAASWSRPKGARASDIP